jgi:hypothetical protein
MRECNAFVDAADRGTVVAPASDGSRPPLEAADRKRGWRSLMRYLVATLVLVLALSGAAHATNEALPWPTFTQATAYVVEADRVACPNSPAEAVLRAMFRFEGDRYAYMAKNGRWVLWRLSKEEPSTGDTVPDHVWFGDQRAIESDDVMNVVADMTYEEAERHFTGPCGWLDLRDTT